MNKKITVIIQTLEELYPEAKCALQWENDSYRLFVMAVLSAQCTDKRVNIVSQELFKKMPTVYAMADSKEGELEELIRSVGLYNSKAKNLRAASKIIVQKHGGNIPSEMEHLLELPGVGRKVANLLRGDIFGLGGIVADTHCIRISQRLGLSNSDNPLKVERDLDKLIPKELQTDFCHRIVLFGRDICSAKNPNCNGCSLNSVCTYK